MNVDSKHFVFKLFDKISIKMLKYDEYIDNFYKQYGEYIAKQVNDKKITIKQLTKTSKGLLHPTTNDTLSFYEYYAERIAMNKDIDIKEVYDMIKKQILGKVTDVDSDDSDTSNTTVLKTNKENIMLVLNTLLDEHVHDDNDDDYKNPDNEEDDDYKNHDDMTKELSKELADKINITPGQSIEKQNLKHWSNCLAQCKIFTKNEKMASLLNIFHIMDINLVNFNQQIPKFKVSDDGEIQLTEENSGIICKKNVIETKLEFINKKPLTVIDDNYCLVANENCMTEGGDSERGIESSITSLYYSSSYNVTAKQFGCFPINYNHIIVVPNVIIFTDEKYNLLPNNQIKKISVIVSPIIAVPLSYDKKIQPIDKNKHDERLYTNIFKLKSPEKIIKQLTGIFDTAAYLGYKNIVLDDRCIIETNAPVMEVINIFNMIIKKFNRSFEKIIFAIENKKIYQLFKKHVSL